MVDMGLSKSCNFKVTDEDGKLIEDAAYKMRVKKAEFMRNAAINEAKRILGMRESGK